MPNEAKQLNEAELMAAEPSTLTDAQIMRRINLANLRKAEREYQLVEEQNQNFSDRKAEKERVARAKTETMKANEESERIRRAACRHKTGGLGLPGFLNGDGKIYGYAVAPQILPTGEKYFICIRCQNEWHLPKKRAVLNGTMTLEQYFAQEREYREVERWEHKTTETPNGEIAGSILFRIPLLDRQRVKDDEEFEAFVNKTKSELAPLSA